MLKEYKHEEPPIEDITLLEPDAVYSYADYLRWAFEERVELIKGKFFKMAAAPSRMHQDVSGELFYAIKQFLQGGRCKAYHAPFDVRFPQHNEKADQQIFTVVQPDICVVCDAAKLDEKGCLGAPDLIVEILSLQSAHRDLKEKYSLYEEKGVKEYWVVYPAEQVVEIFNLSASGKYEKSGFFAGEDIIASNVLKGLQIELKTVFEGYEPRP